MFFFSFLSPAPFPVQHILKTCAALFSLLTSPLAVIIGLTPLFLSDAILQSLMSFVSRSQCDQGNSQKSFLSLKTLEGS